MNALPGLRELVGRLFVTDDEPERTLLTDDARQPFNRTGAQLSLPTADSLRRYGEQQLPAVASAADANLRLAGIAAIRSQYVVDAERIGSVPMPEALTGAFTTVLSALGGNGPEVLVDKLGERLAVARTEVRLYQALIDKTVALSGQRTMPFEPANVECLRDDELEHMHIVASALESLGADSSAQTPSADVAAVAMSGFMQVVSDPRTTIAHCLETLLIAELADGAGWDFMIRLTAKAGQDQFLPQFGRARENEKAHVARLRGWLETLLGQAG